LKLAAILRARWLYRAWYYFRLGYSTYLTFILGYLSTLVTVYYLAIQNIPPLLDLFPRFVPFALLATGLGAPTAVAIGWIHMKRSKLFSSEQDIATEANPYNYKLPRGYMREAWMPVIRMQLRFLRKLSEAEGLVTDSERAEMDELEKKWAILLSGGSVGLPRQSNAKS
jgi:hypothetical protein